MTPPEIILEQMRVMGVAVNFAFADEAIKALESAGWRIVKAENAQSIPSAQALDERPIDDLVGEALRRDALNSIGPLWRDLPEDHRARWRKIGRALLKAAPIEWKTLT